MSSNCRFSRFPDRQKEATVASSRSRAGSYFVIRAFPLRRNPITCRWASGPVSTVTPLFMFGSGVVLRRVPVRLKGVNGSCFRQVRSIKALISLSTWSCCLWGRGKWGGGGLFVWNVASGIVFHGACSLSTHNYLA